MCTNRDRYYKHWTFRMQQMVRCIAIAIATQHECAYSSSSHIPCVRKSVCNYFAIHCNRIWMKHVKPNQTEPRKVKNIIRFRQLRKMCRTLSLPLIRASYMCVCCVSMSVGGWLAASIMNWKHKGKQRDNCTHRFKIDLNFIRNVNSTTTRHFDLVESLHNNIGFWYRRFTEIDIKFCILISQRGEA